MLTQSPSNPPRKGPIKKIDLQQGEDDNMMILYIVYNAIPPAKTKSRAYK